MKALFLTTLIASFAWGDDPIQSSLTLEGEDWSCQTLTIHNEHSSLNWGAPRPQFVDLGLHQVFVGEEPGLIPDTFLVYPANGWFIDGGTYTLEEGETIVVEICPMAGV